MHSTVQNKIVQKIMLISKRKEKEKEKEKEKVFVLFYCFH
jgi:hypothetical protein